MLGITVAAIMKITSKVVFCLSVNKMVSTATMAKYKLEVAHSAPNTTTVTRNIGLAVKPSQKKSLFSQWSYKLNPIIFLYMPLLATTIAHNLTSSGILK